MTSRFLDFLETSKINDLINCWNKVQVYIQLSLLTLITYYLKIKNHIINLLIINKIYSYKFMKYKIKHWLNFLLKMFTYCLHYNAFILWKIKTRLSLLP